MSQPSNVLIGIWSTGLWENLNSPPSISALSISGYAIQPSTIGSLNSRLGTCYSGSGWMGTGSIFTVVPDLGNAEIAIIDALYHITFFNQMAIATMGFGGNTIPFLSLKEGDSTITQANPVNIGKEYREMVKDWNQYLNYLVTSYQYNQQGSAVPRNIQFLNPPAGAWAYPYGNGAGVSYG